MKRRGFTLVELLVSIAIIAILIAMFVPALARAKSSARIAVCMSQLKQWGIVHMQYAQSNAGYFPYRGPTSPAVQHHITNLDLTTLTSFSSTSGYSVTNAVTRRLYHAMLEFGAPRAHYNCPDGAPRYSAAPAWNQLFGSSPATNEGYMVSSYQFIPYNEIYSTALPVSGYTKTNVRITAAKIEYNSTADGRQVPILHDMSRISNSGNYQSGNHWPLGRNMHPVYGWNYGTSSERVAINNQLYMDGSVVGVAGTDTSARTTSSGEVAWW